MFDHTIAAIATPLAQGAISIIRLSGENAISIAQSVFSGNLLDAPSHTIHYGTIFEELPAENNEDTGSTHPEKSRRKVLDEVLVSVFRAPKTYTREDVVEINCHGGVFVTRRVLQLLLSKGAVMAKPGEFTQRAFLNGRIDLSQAEAVEDLIESSSDAEAGQALYAIRGSIRKLLEPLIDDLMDLIANIEVNIDYPEYEDAEQLTFEQLLPRSRALLARMDEIAARSRRGQIFRHGVDTAIIGKPNVGKSSLLNALLEENKAIVTDIPGTTRDLVEGSIQIGGVRLNLIDTAGLRQAKDPVEQIGIEKSRQKMQEAALLLVVLDQSRPLEEEDLQLLEDSAGKDRIILLNKSELPHAFELEEGLPVCAARQDLSTLIEALEKRAAGGLLQENAILANDRQIGLLDNARADMMRAIQAMEMETEPDLIEIDLVSSHDHLKEILGEVHREDLLDTLFTNFCLGK